MNNTAVERDELNDPWSDRQDRQDRDRQDHPWVLLTRPQRRTDCLTLARCLTLKMSQPQSRSVLLSWHCNLRATGGPRVLPEIQMRDKQFILETSWQVRDPTAVWDWVNNGSEWR